MGRPRGGRGPPGESRNEAPSRSSASLAPSSLVEGPPSMEDLRLDHSASSLSRLASYLFPHSRFRLSGKKAKKGKNKGNGKKPHIKTIDGVNPGGWLDGAQGSSEWDEDLQAIDDVTGDYVHEPFIDDVTGDYVAPPDDSD